MQIAAGDSSDFLPPDGDGDGVHRVDDSVCMVRAKMRSCRSGWRRRWRRRLRRVGGDVGDVGDGRESPISTHAPGSAVRSPTACVTRWGRGARRRHLGDGQALPARCGV